MRELDAQNILDYTLENEGGSFRAIDGEPLSFTRGYAVADASASVVLDLSETYSTDVVASIMAFVSAHKEQLNSSSKFLGTWVDGSDLYIEVSELFFSRGEAMRVAQARRQAAIYDFANKEAVGL